MWPLLAITDYYRTTCVHRATPALRIVSRHERLQRASPAAAEGKTSNALGDFAGELGLAGTRSSRGGAAMLHRQAP